MQRRSGQASECSARSTYLLDGRRVPSPVVRTTEPTARRTGRSERPAIAKHAAGTRANRRSARSLRGPGPVGIADADTGCICRERPRAGPSRPAPGGYPREATWGWPGPEPVTTPVARPTWSQRTDAGGSMMSAACRSARAIRSRGLTLCSSSVSSETSSRNGVRSSTPGSPPVFATRPDLAAWAVRRAWSARRPATRPLSRVPSATATSRLVPGLTGVSGAAPGCVSRAASACGSSDTTITSLRDPGRPGLHDGQERSPPGSCLHGNHL